VIGLDLVKVARLRTRLLVGALLFLLGFIGYQTGFSLLFKESRMVSDLLKDVLAFFASIGIPIETFALMLQFGGGIVAIIGFIACLSSLSGPVVRIQTVEASPVTPAIVEKPRCKFCSSFLEEDSAFCPSCGRSQM